MTTRPRSPEAYAATHGRACPACGGSDIGRGEALRLGRQVVTRALLCENCGAAWDAVYTLTGYANLRQAGEDTE